MWGTVQDYAEHAPPTYVYVSFRGNTSVADEMCGAWFNLKHLDAQRLRHQLETYLSYPWRTARFFVQERVGVTFASIQNGQSKLIIETGSALRNFREAIAFFCRGAARIHHENISHNDLHSGNLTITQTADGESFAVKMIDFDRMEQHAENAKSLRFRKDLFCIVSGLYTLVEKTQCSSSHPCVQRNCANEVEALSDLLYKLENTIQDMSSTCSNSTTADFLIKVATEAVSTFLWSCVGI